MNLTLVISSLSSGGAERVLVLLAQGFLARGHQVAVVTIFSQALDFYTLPAGTRRIALDRGGDSKNFRHAIISNVARLWALRRAILATRPDVVISFMDRPNVLTFLSLLGRRIPVVVTEHCDPTQVSPGKFWEWLRRKMYPAAAKVVSVSAGVDRYFTWMPEAKRAVIYNPFLLEKNDAGCAPANTFHSPHTLISMGRLEEQKGFDLLIKAFAKINQQFPDWQVVILGEGTQRPALESLIRQLNLTEIVHLPGRVKNPYPWLRQADLFVLSSRFEGFGNVLVEAMACGLPAVSFDCASGPNEIIRDNVNGVLVPPVDVDALATAMRRLMSNETERRRLAACAVETVEQFSLDKIMEKWEALLDTACR